MRAGQPSLTARGAAAYRAIHQTHEGGAIFKDPLAVKILDDETRAALDQIVADPAQRLMRLFIIARSRFSEDALAASVARGVRQVALAATRTAGQRCHDKGRERKATLSFASDYAPDDFKFDPYGILHIDRA